MLQFYYPHVGWEPIEYVLCVGLKGEMCEILAAVDGDDSCRGRRCRGFYISVSDLGSIQISHLEYP
jgi:hypothetical protein